MEKRDSSGAIGLVEPMKIEKLPVKILSTVHIIKIASGVDHLVMLSSDGQIWTMGNSEQGQLGRINEKFAHRGGRRGLMSLLKPELVRVNFRSKITGFKVSIIDDSHLTKIKIKLLPLYRTYLRV